MKLDGLDARTVKMVYLNSLFLIHSTVYTEDYYFKEIPSFVPVQAIVR